jgi:hypothetical protein
MGGAILLYSRRILLKKEVQERSMACPSRLLKCLTPYLGSSYSSIVCPLPPPLSFCLVHLCWAMGKQQEMRTRPSLDESGIWEKQREADNRADGKKAGERERGLSLPSHWGDRLLSPSLVSLGVLMSEKEKRRAR